MKKLLIIGLSLFSLSPFTYCPDTVIPISTVTTIHQDYLNYLQKKIDEALKEVQTEVREKALKEIYNEITEIVAGMNAAGVPSLHDDTQFVYYILLGLENKVLKAKRSLDLN